MRQRQPRVSWLHAPTDLVNDLGAEPDHMERVEHCHRVREAVRRRCWTGQPDDQPFQLQPAQVVAAAGLAVRLAE